MFIIHACDLIYIHATYNLNIKIQNKNIHEY
jgi:hypothetical protein